MPPPGFHFVDAESFPTGERVLTWKREEDGEEIFVLDFPTRRKAQKVFEGQRESKGFGPPGEGEDDTKRLIEWERDKDFAWHSTIRSDRIEWGSWSVAYRIERSFRDDGTWRDAIRIDLSRGDVNRVLFLVLPEGVAGTEEELLEVCRALDLATGSDR
ncbi:MAG TPA: hypothetical protein ENJ09_07685 [Planctomycetes bacterium]|nr:hypothetical protein [Planctomycetota bacterium]